MAFFPSLGGYLLALHIWLFFLYMPHLTSQIEFPGGKKLCPQSLVSLSTSAQDRTLRRCSVNSVQWPVSVALVLVFLFPEKSLTALSIRDMKMCLSWLDTLLFNSHVPSWPTRPPRNPTQKLGITLEVSWWLRIAWVMPWWQNKWLNQNDLFFIYTTCPSWISRGLIYNSYITPNYSLWDRISHRSHLTSRIQKQNRILSDHHLLKMSAIFPSAPMSPPLTSLSSMPIHPTFPISRKYVHFFPSPKIMLISIHHHCLQCWLQS